MRSSKGQREQILGNSSDRILYWLCSASCQHKPLVRNANEVHHLFPGQLPFVIVGLPLDGSGIPRECD